MNKQKIAMPEKGDIVAHRSNIKVKFVIVSISENTYKCRMMTNQGSIIEELKDFELVVLERYRHELICVDDKSKSIKNIEIDYQEAQEKIVGFIKLYPNYYISSILSRRRGKVSIGDINKRIAQDQILNKVPAIEFEHWIQHLAKKDEKPELNKYKTAIKAYVEKYPGSPVSSLLDELLLSEDVDSEIVNDELNVFLSEGKVTHKQVARWYDFLSNLNIN